MEYIEESEKLVGYRVKMWEREAFKIVGYTRVFAPGQNSAVPGFWDEVIADGRLATLKQASSVPAVVLGLGSWDPECQKGGQRYTICIEEAAHTDSSLLAAQPAFFRKEIGASLWMCFELSAEIGPGCQFWRDNPYKMMKTLGYEFNSKDYSVGLHFETYPPEDPAAPKPMMEFWITVVRL